MNLSKNRRIVFVLATGGLLTLVMILLAIRPIRAAGPWFVAPGGDDGNDCLSPATPCATINGAIGKASPGDTIFVAIGTYTGTGDEVVSVDKDATLSGGWDETFTEQSGSTTVDGESSRRGMTVVATAIIERFTFQHGSGPWGYGGGIMNHGSVTLNDCTVRANTAGDNGGGIYQDGITSMLILNNSTVSGNTALKGGGISNNIGTAVLNSSTVSDNTGLWVGGAIVGTGTLQNTILAGNTSPSGPDCYGTIASSGYNLIGDTTDCTFTATTGDLTNVDAQLATFEGSPGYHPLKFTSPAIDGGNPAGCADHLGAPLTTDQRGTPRPLDGDGDDEAICDIGSYEFDPDENPLFAVYLPIILRNH